MARASRTSGLTACSLVAGVLRIRTRLKVPFMRHNRSQNQVPRGKFDRGGRPLVVGLLNLVFGVGSLVLAAGCDLLDPTKSDNPVFQPPPPRTTQVDDKSGKTKYKFVDDPQTPPNKTAAADAPAGPIKQTGFTQGAAAAGLGKISGNEVVATVNGQPIFAAEIFERAAPEALTREGLSLMVADKLIKAKDERISEAEYRQLQEIAIKRYLRDYIKTRVLSQALESTLEKEQKQKIEEALGKMYDEYVERLKKDMKVTNRYEVDKKLREQGSSLTSLKAEFRSRLLADEYLRGKSKREHIVGRQEILKYYQEHLEDYSFPERVSWELIEIRFEKHGGSNGALKVLEKAVDELSQGTKFEAVARKYSDGPRASEGGKQAWTRPENVADEKTAAALRELAAGETSPVLHSRDAFRLIRMIERKPAGRKTLAEVQDVIRQKLEDELQKEAIKTVLVEAFQHSSIESKYLTPEEAATPAEDAGLSSPSKKAQEFQKKRRERS